MNKLKMNSIAIARPTFTMSTEDDREVHALTEWINALLSSPGLDVENSFEIERLLEKTSEANSRLKEILMSLSQLPTRMTTPQKLNVSQRTNTPQKLNTPQRSRLAAAAESMDHIDLSTLRQKRLNEQWRHKATNLYSSSDVPRKIFQLVESGQVGIRKGLVVSTHIGLQVDLLALLLNFHPIWLKLALETVFGVEIVLPMNSIAPATQQKKMRFVPTIANFIRHNLFTSEALVKRGKELVAGPDVIILLHKHFLSNLCQIFYVIESMVTQAVVPNIPCMFLKSSQYKCMQDVYGYLSREVIAGSTNLPKMLARVGFEANYKQGFFEEYDYHVEDLLADLSDGIILARVIETLTVKDGHLPGDLISKLRNPSGDRIRKIYNVRMVLTEAVHRFPTKFHGGEVKAEDIVAAKRSVIVKFVLQLADIQEATAVVKIQAFLCTELRRRKGSKKMRANSTVQWIQHSRAANLIQMFVRKQILLSECAILIQSAFRRVFSNRLVEAEKVKVVMLRLKEKLAVICIQSFSWKYICRRSAAIGIQSVFRQFIDACQVKSKVDCMKNRVEMQGQIEELAIVIIQTSFRKKSLVIKAVIAIQSMLRQVCSVRQVVLEKAKLTMLCLKEKFASVSIQPFNIKEFLRKQICLLESIVKIQTAFRQMIVVIRVKAKNDEVETQNRKESVAISRIQYFLGNQIFSYKACIKIQAFLRRFSAIHLVDAKPCEIRVRQSVVNIQSLVRSFVAQTRFRDDLIDGTLSLSLTTRRLSASRLGLSSEYRGLEKLLDSIEELSRGHPSELVLRPVSNTILNILTNSVLTDDYPFFEDLIENSVKQIYHYYKDEEVVVTNAKILKILKQFGCFRGMLARTRYDWFLKQFKKHFGRLPRKDARFVVYNEILKLLEK